MNEDLLEEIFNIQCLSWGIEKPFSDEWIQHKKELQNERRILGKV